MKTKIKSFFVKVIDISVEKINTLSSDKQPLKGDIKEVRFRKVIKRSGN